MSGVTRIIPLLLLLASGTIEAFDQETDWSSSNSLHDFHLTDLSSNDVSLSKYKGSVVLLLTGATKCPISLKGFRQLEKLRANYAEGFEAVAIVVDGLVAPSGNAAEIREFASKNGFGYDIYDKLVLNGPEAHPVYKWMRNQASTDGNVPVGSKLLFDKSGQPVALFNYNDPLEQIEQEIKKYL